MIKPKSLKESIENAKQVHSKFPQWKKDAFKINEGPMIQEYEKIYDEFWKDIIEVDGAINLDQLKRELHDFYKLISNASKVYCHVTNNLLSKPNYDADTIISIADDKADEWTNQCIDEALEDSREEIKSLKALLNKVESLVTNGQNCIQCSQYGDGRIYKHASDCPFYDILNTLGE